MAKKMTGPQIDSNNTLENFPDLTYVEIDLIIELVRDDGRKLSSGYFMVELEDLLMKYAEPAHKYRMQFHDKPEAAETNFQGSSLPKSLQSGKNY